MNDRNRRIAPVRCRLSQPVEGQLALR